MIPSSSVPPLIRAAIVLVASGKGGTGKSTLALALAEVWASTGRRVALVDADPQAGATTAAGLAPVEDPLAALPVDAHGFALHPAGRALAAADAGAHADRIRRAATVAEVVVVDASPALTDPAHAGALAVALEAEGALVLVAARTDAAGLPSVAEAVAMADAAGVALQVVPTFTGGTGLARESLAFLRGRYGDRVTVATIPQDARAAEAAGVGRPVTRTARRSRVAEAVRALAAELGNGLVRTPDNGPDAPAHGVSHGVSHGVIAGVSGQEKRAVNPLVRTPDNGVNHAAEALVRTPDRAGTVPTATPTTTPTGTA
jgi:cellulose biosynthesis protein BcsQ